jgi:hypothetical protein
LASVHGRRRSYELRLEGESTDFEDTMHIIQFEQLPLGRCLGVIQNDKVVNVTAQNPQISNTVAAFRAARRDGRSLADSLRTFVDKATGLLDYAELLAANRVLPPIDEAAGARLLISGTGLTHSGSGQQRDAMHKKDPAAPRSDSRRMFDMGLEGGRPAPGQRGAMPEWFYKGDGRILRGPGQPLDIPPFAPDGGEEPEIVGIYVIDDEGTPWRLGFTQGNEWSDHVTENINYLLLAPSKLRVCAIGPELVTDLPFEDCRGRCRVFRSGRTIYDSGELRSGEKNMCHSLANLEDHHFKYPQHRQAGDVHVHFFGTSKLSYQERDWQYQSGDEVEISFAGLGAPLRHPVRRHAASAVPIRVAQA